MTIIKSKIEVNITIMIFLLVAIKEFLLVHQPELAGKVFVAFSIIVAIHIFNYGLYYLFRRNLFNNFITNLINYLLTINFFFISGEIVYIMMSMSSKFSSHLSEIIHKLLGYCLSIIILIPIIILILFVIFVPYQKRTIK
jgi:hypothetical protein